MANMQSPGADSIETLLSSIELPLHDENMVVPTHVGEDIMDAVQTIILCAQHQKRIVDDILLVHQRFLLTVGD